MRWLLVLLMLMCSGCASPRQPLPVAMFPEPESPAPLPMQTMTPRTVESWPMVPHAKDPMRLIENANGVALIEPSSHDFRRAVVRFPYKDGAVFRIDTALEKATTLTFGATEEIKTISRTGERWDMEPVTEVLPHRIILSPKEPTLRTRISVVTTWRVYHLDLRANAKTSLVEVQWDPPPAPAVHVEAARYGVGYGISDGAYSWRPAYAWDDGLHLFLLFGSSLPAGDAPAVAVLSGEARQLVNYRVHDRVMRLDRLIDPTEAVELAVGVDDQGRRLEIRRTTGYQTITCPGAAPCAYIEGWLRKEAHARSLP